MRKHKNVNSSSSEEESEYALQDSDAELILSDSEESDMANCAQELDSNLRFDDFAIVKVYGKTKTVLRMYIRKISLLEDNGYVGIFYKKSIFNHTFLPTEEEFFFLKDGVMKNHMPPVEASKSSSRM